MGSSSYMLKEFKQDMMKTFEMIDLGLLQYFLILEVKQTARLVHAGQKIYVEEVLNRAGMLNCRMMSTPMNTNEKLHLSDNSGSTDEKRYRWIVGGLLYLMHTRPDLTFAVGLVT